MAGKLISYLRFLKGFYSLEFKSAMEYRLNFIMQSAGMFINDLFWVFFWFILFQRFENINGWNFGTMLVMYSIFPLSYGLAAAFLGNWRNIAKLIENGSVDYYLTLPREVLTHLIARMRYSGVGDIVFGLVIGAFAIPLIKWPLYLYLTILSSAILLGWAIFCGTFAFFIGRFERASKTMNNSVMMIAGYPFSVYSGVTKFVLLFIIPAGFVVGIPVEILTEFSLKWLVIATLYCFGFLAFSVWFFYLGLRRYESGNVMAMRG